MKINLLLVIGVIALVACNDGEGRYPKSASYSECIKTFKSAVDSTGDKILREDYLTYEVTKDYTLKLEAHNIPMNCAVEGVEASVEQNGKNDVSIHFEWWGDGSNCMCPRTITYSLDNLEKGADYHFTVTVSVKNDIFQDSASFDIKNLLPHTGADKIKFKIAN